MTAHHETLQDLRMFEVDGGRASRELASAIRRTVPEARVGSHWSAGRNHGNGRREPGGAGDHKGQVADSPEVGL